MQRSSRRFVRTTAIPFALPMTAIVKCWPWPRLKEREPGQETSVISCRSDVTEERNAAEGSHQLDAFRCHRNARPSGALAPAIPESAAAAGTREPSWEPPIDVLETEREILIFIALPGVDPNEVEAILEKGALVVSGRRTLPAEVRDARILRLELPQGRFERRIALPSGRYAISRFAANGCIGLRLAKSN